MKISTLPTSICNWIDSHIVLNFYKSIRMERQIGSTGSEANKKPPYCCSGVIPTQDDFDTENGGPLLSEVIRRFNARAIYLSANSNPWPLTLRTAILASRLRATIVTPRRQRDRRRKAYHKQFVRETRYQTWISNNEETFIPTKFVY